MKSNSKLLLELRSEGFCLLAWKDAHDTLLSEKYSIYNMVLTMCSYIRVFPFLSTERDVRKADGRLS